MWVGGILISTIATSGRVSLTLRNSSSGLPTLPVTSNPASVRSRSRPFSEKDFVVSDHDAHGISARILARPLSGVGDLERAVKRAEAVLYLSSSLGRGPVSSSTTSSPSSANTFTITGCPCVCVSASEMSR